MGGYKGFQVYKGEEVCTELRSGRRRGFSFFMSSRGLIHRAPSPPPHLCSVLRLWTVPMAMPKPNCALSSNRELAQAGPWPSSLVVYGLEGALRKRGRGGGGGRVEQRTGGRKGGDAGGLSVVLHDSHMRGAQTHVFRPRVVDAAVAGNNCCTLLHLPSPPCPPATPDGGAARGVGDDEPLAEQLREQLHVRRLAAALAGAAELQQRRGELRALDRGPLECGVALGQLGGAEGPVGVLDREHLLNGLGLERLVWAGYDAELAASAVVRGDLSCVWGGGQRMSSGGLFTGDEVGVRIPRDASSLHTIHTCMRYL